MRLMKIKEAEQISNAWALRGYTLINPRLITHVEPFTINSIGDACEIYFMGNRSVSYLGTLEDFEREFDGWVP